MRINERDLFASFEPIGAIVYAARFYFRCDDNDVYDDRREFRITARHGPSYARMTVAFLYAARSVAMSSTMQQQQRQRRWRQPTP